MMRRKIVVIQFLLGVLVTIIAVIGFALNYSSATKADEFYERATLEIISISDAKAEAVIVPFEDTVNCPQIAPESVSFIPTDEIVLNEEIIDFEGETARLNSDWENYIYIPGTQICYPVVQADNNEFYLDHLPDGSYGKCGSIFLDYQNKTGDFNLVLYGHNMKNGSMFGQLDKYYTDEEFFTEKNRMFLCLNNVARQYELFSVQKVPYNSEVYFITPANEETWVDRQKIASIVDCTLSTDCMDQFVTLSTCGKTETEKVVTVWKSL